jgi:hypothetical protein
VARLSDSPPLRLSLTVGPQLVISFASSLLIAPAPTDRVETRGDRQTGGHL